MQQRTTKVGAIAMGHRILTGRQLMQRQHQKGAAELILIYSLACIQFSPSTGVIRLLMLSMHSIVIHCALRVKKVVLSNWRFSACTTLFSQCIAIHNQISANYTPEIERLDKNCLSGFLAKHD